jgi:hypothetical protein
MVLDGLIVHVNYLLLWCILRSLLLVMNTLSSLEKEFRSMKQRNSEVPSSSRALAGKQTLKWHLSHLSRTGKERDSPHPKCSSSSDHYASNKSLPSASI